MGVVYILVRHLSPHPHPPNFKEVSMVLSRFSNVLVHLPPFQPSHGPTSLYSDSKGSEADVMALTRGQTSPIPG